jgi:hypothetical protein
VNLNLAGEHFGYFVCAARSGCLEIDRDGLAYIFKGGFYRFALRHAAGQLGDVGDVTVILQVKDEIDQETLFAAHTEILASGATAQEIFEAVGTLTAGERRFHE